LNYCLPKTDIGFIIVQPIEHIMERKTTFIGHRDFLPSDIEQRLRFAVQKEIDSGCRHFIVGSHGEFDRLALSVCKAMRQIYPDIKIEVAITSFNQDYYDVETVMFEIEEVHYKRRIIESNKQMIDACDTLICYVRPNSWRSGAKEVLNYAQSNNKIIINIGEKMNLIKTIHEKFLERNPDADYNKLFSKTIEKERELSASLTFEQKSLLNQLLDDYQSLQLLEQVELIKFTLSSVKEVYK